MTSHFSVGPLWTRHMVPATHGPIQTGKTKLKNDINGRITSGYQIISLKISVWGRLVLVGLVLTNQPTCSSLSSSKSLSSLAIFVVSTLLLRGDYLYLDLCFHVPLFFFFYGMHSFSASPFIPCLLWLSSVEHNLLCYSHDSDIMYNIILTNKFQVDLIPSRTQLLPPWILR